MSYRFCFGASGAGKSRLLHEEIITRSVHSLRGEDAQGIRNYYLIVPDQYTMQTQKDLVIEHPDHTIMNIDVLSFGRLALRVLEEVGGDDRSVLNDTGKSLVLRRVADRISDELEIIGSSLHKTGMIAEIKSVLSELFQYGIGEEELDRLIDFAEKGGQIALSKRLRDLKILYNSFREYEKDNFITAEETMDVLAEAIPHSEKIKNSMIVFDGFTGFTPVQYKVLEALLANAKEIVFAVTIAEDGGPAAGECTPENTLGDEQNLFNLSRKTIRNIHKYAQRAGALHAADIVAGGDGNAIDMRSPGRFADNPVLAHLEKNIFRHPVKRYADPCGESLRILRMQDPEEEIRRICIMIRQMISEEGYKYSDFALVTGDLPGYAELIEKQMRRYAIPVYIDRTGSIMKNPLTELIRSALELRSRNFSYASVFRYLRSGLSSLSAEEVDRLENYALAHGVSGLKKWLLSFDEDMDEIRRKFLHEIEPFIEDRIAETGRANLTVRTVGERTKQLYAFLVRCDAQRKLLRMSAEFALQGDSAREKEYAQIYEAVCALLDQIYELVGEEKISAADYSELVESGLEEIKLGAIPQRADRVLAGDIERTRLTQIKVLFFAGVNEGIIPLSSSGGGLISDLDREFLAASDIELSPGPREKMYMQRLYLYLNMTKPSEKLIVTYSETSYDGRSLRPSYLIMALSELFTNLKQQNARDISEIESMTSEKDTAAYIAQTIREYAEGVLDENAQKEFFSVYRWCTDPVRQYQIRDEIYGLTENAFMRYEPAALTSDTAMRIYGRFITGSITRLETAAQCYMRQFLQYGLRLKKREEFVFEPADSGTIMHHSLQIFSKYLRERNLEWRTFDEQTGRELIQKAVEETAASYHDLLMYSTHRNTYAVQKIQRTLQRSIDTLQYQLQQGEFEPAAYELRFGGGSERAAISYDLGDQRKMYLTGQIDRLDLSEKDGRLYVKILDYKSGSRDLKAEQIRSGLQLQLLIYMQAILESERRNRGEENVIPAALLYYRLLDPVIDLKGEIGSPQEIRETETAADPETAEAALPEEVLREIRKKLRPTGLVSGDGDVVHLLDKDPGKDSLVIPVGYKKSGEFTSASKVFSMEEYEKLSEIVREKVCELGRHILEGDTTAQPVKMDSTRTACDYCPYKNVCGFDRSIPGYEYKEISDMQDGE